MEHKKRIISICGNIGSGKSTLVNQLNHSQREFDVIQEPISEMNDLLCKFYENMSKWAFHLQCKVLLLYSSIYKNMNANSINYIIERSPAESKHIFAMALLESNFLTSLEYSLYIDLYNELSWEPDCIIYVRTPPNICFQRINSRNRECEKDISIDYINQLHNLYEKYFEKYKYSKNIFVIDGSLDIDSVQLQCKKLLNL